MNIPKSETDKLTPAVNGMLHKWGDFMGKHVKFNMPDSEFHAAPHCERVLLFAMIIGDCMFGDDAEALEILAHASVFHDTQRQDDYLDTGHGARAAVYYEDFCKENDVITFHPESVYLMRYHDLDDKIGEKAIRQSFGERSDRVLKLYAAFKDSDALDRWRLGSLGLDPRYLRTAKAQSMVEYARKIVNATIPADELAKIDTLVKDIMSRQTKKEK